MKPIVVKALISLSLLFSTSADHCTDNDAELRWKAHRSVLDMKNVFLKPIYFSSSLLTSPHTAQINLLTTYLLVVLHSKSMVIMLDLICWSQVF